jgi:hypothetical protein
MPAPRERIATAMVPDDWLSDAENATPRRIWLDFVHRTNSFAYATDQFSTIREFMLEIQGFHAPWGIPIPTESFMLHCNRRSQI